MGMLQLFELLANRREGSEIFYRAPDNKLRAAAVNGKGSSFEVGAVKPLFQIRMRAARYSYYGLLMPSASSSILWAGKSNSSRRQSPWSSTGPRG